MLSLKRTSDKIVFRGFALNDIDGIKVSILSKVIGTFTETHLKYQVHAEVMLSVEPTFFIKYMYPQNILRKCSVATNLQKISTVKVKGVSP